MSTTTHPLRRTEEVRAALALAVRELADRTRTVFEEVDDWPDEATCVSVTEHYVRALLDSSHKEVEAAVAAREVATSLIDSATADDPEWWGTPLGAVVAWHIGYHRAHVHANVVARVLGVSRARAYKLTEGSEVTASISANELRHRLRERLGQPDGVDTPVNGAV